MTSAVSLPQRPLGKLDITTAALALGTVKLGRNSGVKYPANFTLPSDREVSELLALAQDCGINLIDTAPAYGNSEARLGQLLPGPRADWIISTKAGEHFDGARSHYDYSQDSVNRSIDQSLKNLRTDYLDIVMIHSDGRDEEIMTASDVVATLKQRQQQGDIRYIGLSGKTIAGAELGITLCDVLMVTFNESDESHRRVIQSAADQGLGILVKKAMASGHADPADSLAFVLSEPAVHTAVIGTINPGHLRGNVEVAARLATQVTTTAQH